VNRPLGVVRQVRLAFRPGARLATTIGFLLGGFVPVAVFVLCHADALASLGETQRYRLWSLVAGGLIYSAKTVFEWARLAFTSAIKSVGFCVLLEGVMVTSTTAWLAYTALAYLVCVNGIATGCALSVRVKR